MLLEAQGSRRVVSTYGSHATTLSDLASGQWYSKYVGYAITHDIVSGYPDGSFKPLDTVDTAEFLKMFSLVYELELDLSYDYLDVSEDDWFAPYVGLVSEYDLMLEEDACTLNPGRELTRYDVAIALYQYDMNSGSF